MPLYTIYLWVLYFPKHFFSGVVSIVHGSGGCVCNYTVPESGVEVDLLENWFVWSCGDYETFPNVSFSFSTVLDV